MSSPQNDEITLVSVSTLEEELALVDDLREAGLAGGNVVPVLDVDRVPSRLADSLETAGRAVRRGTRADALRLHVGTKTVRPRMLFVSDGVPEAIVALAALLCDAAPVPLTTFWTAASFDGDTGAGVLVLVNPEASSRPVTALLEVMASRDVPTGLVFCSDRASERLSLLKALLADRVRGDGRFAVIRGDVLPGASDAPTNLAHPRSTGDASAASVFTRDQDLLVVTGHALPQDMHLGPDFILCAKVGMTASVEEPALGLLSCFRDGRCWRQLSFGRDARDRTGLVAPQGYRARVVAFFGCNMVVPGAAWAHPRHGLVHQAASGTALAVVTATELIDGHFDRELLLIALLARGLPLGRVVLELNRAYRASEAPSAGRAGGPFLLIGNPNLRLDGLRLVDAVARAEGTKLSIDLASIAPDRDRGALLRVPVAESTRRAFLRLDDGSEGFAVGVVHDDSLYAWVSLAGRRALALDAAPVDPLADLLAAARQAAAEIAFWMLLLDAYRDAMTAMQASDRGAGEAAERVDATLNRTLPAARGVLERTLQAAGRPGTLEGASRAQPVIAASLARDLERLGMDWLEAFLECVFVVGCFRSFSYREWGALYALVEASPPSSPCPCGRGLLWTETYRSPATPTTRVFYHGTCCGPVGEDDGTKRLEVVEAQIRVRRGESLRWRCRARAGEAMLLGRVTLAMEFWLKQDRLSSPPSAIRLGRGEESLTELAIEIPATLEVGAYPCVMGGVTNGVLTTTRLMVDVVA